MLLSTECTIYPAILLCVCLQNPGFGASRNAANPFSKNHICQASYSTTHAGFAKYERNLWRPYKIINVIQKFCLTKHIQMFMFSASVFLSQVHKLAKDKHIFIGWLASFLSNGYVICYKMYKVKAVYDKYLTLMCEY